MHTLTTHKHTDNIHTETHLHTLAHMHTQRNNFVLLDPHPTTEWKVAEFMRHWDSFRGKTGGLNRWHRKLSGDILKVLLISGITGEGDIKSYCSHSVNVWEKLEHGTLIRTLEERTMRKCPQLEPISSSFPSTLIGIRRQKARCFSLHISKVPFLET